MDAALLGLAAALPATIPTNQWVALGGTICEALNRYQGHYASDGSTIFAASGYVNANNASLNCTLITPGSATGYQSMPSIPAATYQGVAAYAGGRFHVIGGYVSSNGATSANSGYSPSGANKNTGSWGTYTAMPVSLYQQAAAVIGQYIYVSGGLNSSGSPVNTLYRYDTSANSWTTLTAMPTTRYGHSMNAVGTKLYVIGGIDSSSNNNNVMVYDTVAGTWTTLATPAVPGQVSSGNVVTTSVAVGTNIYVWVSAYIANGFFLYNTSTNTWTTLADVPYLGGGPGARMVLVNGSIYLCGSNSNVNAGGGTIFQLAPGIATYATTVAALKSYLMSVP